MKLHYRLFVILIPFLIIPTGALSFFVFAGVQSQILSLQKDLMYSQVKELKKKAESEDQKLQRLGLEGSSFYKAAIRKRFIEDLKSQDFQGSSFFILSPNGEFLFSSFTQPGTFIPPQDNFWKILHGGKGQGQVFIKSTLTPDPQANHLVIYDLYGPWNWVMGLMIEEGKILAPVQNSILLFIFFLLGYLAYSSLAIFFTAKGVSRPLGRLMVTTQLFGNGDLSARASVKGNDEASHLAHSFNAMAEKIEELNQTLEAKVIARTRELSDSLEILKTTQEQLIQSEKMADLGSLVAGVAHEINTPLGIGVTSASHLESLVKELGQRFHNQTLTQSWLSSFLEKSEESVSILLKNLSRAANLIQNFKQVAVDQSHEGLRSLNFRTHLDDILLSLHPRLKHTKIKVQVSGPEDLVITTYPGAWWQITTNMVINSLVHGFSENLEGTIRIQYEAQEGYLLCRFEDDGSGIDERNLPFIFDPFFTTKRQQGGTGLGLHIVYNLVNQKLKGTIKCQSIRGQGTTFLISVPITHEETL